MALAHWLVAFKLLASLPSEGKPMENTGSGASLKPLPRRVCAGAEQGVPLGASKQGLLGQLPWAVGQTLLCPEPEAQVRTAGHQHTGSGTEQAGLTRLPSPSSSRTSSAHTHSLSLPLLKS